MMLVFKENIMEENIMEENKRKVAIIRTRDKYISNYGDYDDYCAKIVDSITDWEVVTENEFQALYHGQQKHGYLLMEKIDRDGFEQIKLKTVAEYIKHLEVLEKQKKQREEERAKKSQKSQAKKAEREYKKFLELQKKFITKK